MARRLRGVNLPDGVYRRLERLADERGVPVERVARDLLSRAARGRTPRVTRPRQTPAGRSCIGGRPSYRSFVCGDMPDAVPDDIARTPGPRVRGSWGEDVIAMRRERP